MGVIIVVCICLALMLLIVFSTIFKLATSSRAERLLTVQNFKKGKFAAIYVVAIPLFILGYMYNGSDFLLAFVNAVKDSVDLVFLKLKYDGIKALMNDNALYYVAMYLCYFLTFLNAGTFTITIFWKKIVNKKLFFRAVHTSPTVYVIIGNNTNNKSMIRSFNEPNASIIYVVDADSKETDFAYVHECALMPLASPMMLSTTIEKIFKKVKTTKNINFIINTEDDRTNLLYASQVDKLLSTFGGESPLNIKASVFCSSNDETNFISYEEKTGGRIRYVSKYRLVAYDFVDKYPLTEFMDDEYIDYDNAVLRDDVDVNVAMIGFGKSSRQLFLTMVACNEFVTKDNDGNIQPKIVDYFAYDKDLVSQSKNFNHTFNRYANMYDELAKNDDAYFGLPFYTANLHDDKGYELDINDEKFYKQLRSNLVATNGRKAYNYIIVNFGSDLENIDMAEKLYRKTLEWNIDHYTHIFVKVRDDLLTKEVLDNTTNHFITFGNEGTLVYNIDKIFNERNEMMAKYKHINYYAQNKNIDLSTAKEDGMHVWYNSYDQVRRDSNTYACLSMRHKLNMLGYDICEQQLVNGDHTKSAEQLRAELDFINEYTRDDAIVYKDGITIDGRSLISYNIASLKDDSIRHTYAVEEHYRWNAYEISAGIIPATIDDSLDEEKAKYLKDTRQHANLSTYDGLIKYRNTKSDRLGITKDEADVIKYDYQIMDDAVWWLNKFHYSLVNKKIKK